MIENTPEVLISKSWGEIVLSTIVSKIKHEKSASVKKCFRQQQNIKSYSEIKHCRQNLVKSDVYCVIFHVIVYKGQSLFTGMRKMPFIHKKINSSGVVKESVLKIRFSNFIQELTFVEINAYWKKCR